MNSFSFAHPDSLYALWLLPLFALCFFFEIQRKKSRLALYSKHRLEELITQSPSVARVWLKRVLFFGAILGLILALARPRWQYGWKEVPQNGVEIMVLVDLSLSMRAQDIRPSRIERARRELHDLTKLMKTDRLGIIAFAGVSFVHCPLTVDYKLAQMFINQLDTSLMPVQGTALGDAIDLAVSSLEKSSSANNEGRAIILITDGEDQNARALEAAKNAKSKGIRIFVVGVGSHEGAPIPLNEGGFKKDSNGQLVVTKLAESTLNQIANETGGVYVRSTTGDMDLDRIYTQGIKKSVKDKTFSTTKEKLWQEHYQLTLGIAFILLLIDSLITEYSRRKKVN